MLSPICQHGCWPGWSEGCSQYGLKRQRWRRSALSLVTEDVQPLNLISEKDTRLSAAITDFKSISPSWPFPYRTKEKKRRGRGRRGGLAIAWKIFISNFSDWNNWLYYCISSRKEKNAERLSHGYSSAPAEHINSDKHPKKHSDKHHGCYFHNSLAFICSSARVTVDTCGGVAPVWLLIGWVDGRMGKERERWKGRGLSGTKTRSAGQRPLVAIHQLETK